MRAAMRRAMTSSGDEMEMLTVPEVAGYLRVSRSLVYQLTESGRLPTYRVGMGRGAVRVSKEDLSRYVESCKHETGETVVRPPRRREKLRHLKV
jgi:excisionase family DNA binding protein